MAEQHEGHCLCGAVRVRVDGPMAEISGCHCSLCRRYGGGVQFGIAVEADRVEISGPVKIHRSSPIAERAWCDTCGSPVWFKDVDGENADWFELSPGLFDDAGGARLTRIVYADRAVGGMEIAGDIQRVTRSEYEAEFPHLNEEV